MHIARPEILVWTYGYGVPQIFRTGTQPDLIHENQQLGRIGNVENAPNFSQNLAAVDVINAGNSHNHGIQETHNRLHQGFHCIHLAIQ